jgi:hypothetical protein
MDDLLKWLEQERLALEDNAMSEKPDLFDQGYYAGIINTLDFIQGAEVFTEFHQLP